MPKLLDGKYFTIVSHDQTKVEAKCKTCNQTRKGDTRSTGNFMEHIRTKHPELVKEVDDYRKNKSTIDSKSLKQTSLRSMSFLSPQIVSLTSHFLGNSMLIFFFFFQLLSALLKFVVECNLPFSTVQKPSFIELINLVAGRDIETPKTKVFMKFLEDQYNAMKTKLTDLLRKQKYLCVTCDVWSSRAQSYIGITVHFIDERYQRESFVLAFRELKYKQTHDVLAREIIKVFNEYGIHVEKVTNIVTDGGSAFCKAFKVYGKGADQLVEYTEPTQRSFDLFEIEFDDHNDVSTTAMPYMQYDDGEYFYSNILNLENDDSSEDDLSSDGFEENDAIEAVATGLLSYLNSEDANANDEAADVPADLVNHENLKLPRQRRCTSHLLNLVPNDFEKKLSGNAQKALITTLSKLQVIWVVPRRSSLAKTICKEVLGEVLKILVETRWNSKYDSIAQIFKLKLKINTYIEKLKVAIGRQTSIQQLTKEDWTVIGTYLKIMEPVAISLDRLQGEKDCGQGYIIPTLVLMRHQILSLDGGLLLNDFREVMLQVIQRRFHKFFDQSEANKDLIIRKSNAFIGMFDAFDTRRAKLQFQSTDKSNCL